MAISPAMRTLIVHCVETGALLPDDPVRAPKSTIDAMVRRGWLLQEGTGYLLTEKGKAAYPWY